MTTPAEPIRSHVAQPGARRPISDFARRTICRTVFLVSCAIPTAATLYWIAHRPTANDWERNILAHWGLATEIESIETPRPGLTQLRGVRIERPLQPDHSPLRLNLVEVHLGSVHRIVVRDRIELTPDELYAIVRQTRRHVLELNLVQRPWQLEFQKLTLRHTTADGPTMTWAPAKIEIDRTDEEIRVLASLHLLGSSAAHSIRASLLQPAPDAGGHSQITIDTGGAPIPCWVARRWVPDLRTLGDQALFRGVAQLTLAPDQHVSGAFQGQFEQIDLGQLTGTTDASVLGMGTATIEQGQIAGNRIHRLKGNFESAGGAVPRRLVEAAQRHLQMETLQAIELPHVQFSKLAFEFFVEQDRFFVGERYYGGILFDASGQPVVDCRYDNQNGAIPQNLVSLARFWVAQKRDGDLPDSDTSSTQREIVDILQRFDLPRARQAQAESNRF